MKKKQWAEAEEGEGEWGTKRRRKTTKQYVL